MAPLLVACAACQKHVRDDEARCPFCGAARTPGSGASVLPVPTFDRDVLHVVPAYGGPFRARERRNGVLVAVAVAVGLGLVLGLGAYWLR